jgi:hypothetical protein
VADNASTVIVDAQWRAMQTTSRGDSDAAASRGKRSAARFFWGWLIVATAMSVTGNVAHAVLHAPAGTLALAAGAALVPPVVLLAATHSVAVLVRARAGGFTYWCALLMTLALASCAFVLSFDALRSLAITLGLPESIAWLWPCAIDVAIAQATLCLLSLSRWQTPLRAGDELAAEVTPAQVARTGERHRAALMSSVARPASATDIPDAGVADRAASPARAAAEVAEPVLPAGSWDGAAAIKRWRPVAESLVREGVTSKHPQLVATILAQREAGVPPSTIGRTYKVHHTTVGRILSAAGG